MGETFEIDISGVGAGGDGIARHDGKVVFVPGALPRERVRVERARSGAAFDRANLLSVVTPSAGRRASPCRHDHAGGCGGCALLHGDRATGAAIKHQLVTDAMVRIGGADAALIAPTATPGPEFGYRNHVRFGVGSGGTLTFVARGEGRGSDRKTMTIDTCLVLHPTLDRIRGELMGRMAGVREVELRIGAATGETLVILHGAKRVPEGINIAGFSGALAIADDAKVVPVRGMPWIHDTAAGQRFRISARSFFQVNTDGATCLAELVRAEAAVGPGARVLDLYAGVGLFALGSFDPGVEVIAAEVEAAAVADFRINSNGRAGVSIRQLAVEEFLCDFAGGRDRFDVAVVDPPRAGVGTALLDQLNGLAIPRIVMVSCDAGTCARDVKTLTGHGYQLARVTPVDQFPGTPHVEVVAVLTRV